MLYQNNHSAEIKTTQSRIYVIAITITMLTGILVARLFYLQGIKNDRFSTLANNNRIHFQAIAPIRGLIYDRNGELLAKNVRTFNLQLQADQIKDVPQVIADIRDLIDISNEDVERFNDLSKTKPGFEPQTLKINLSEREVAKFAANQYRFQGTQLNARLQRTYPQKDLTTHALGYVGRINAEDLKKAGTKKYQGIDYIGKNGIENHYENILSGRPGSQKVETNAHGRVVRRSVDFPAEPGQTLHLSLDIKLQEKSLQALQGYEGAVVTIEPSTGDILSFVSAPSYDANFFVNGISDKNYATLRMDTRRPLLNRALYGRYSPGSTIKGFMSLVGMNDGIGLDTAVFCPGWYSLPNNKHRYRCWKKTGHGKVDGSRAIVESCDVYYYQLANRLGIDKIFSGMSMFGFGKKTGVDLQNEPSGLMPSREWKKQVRGEAWYPGETVITGIGQGYMLITPIQLATATVLLANRGKKVTPRFLVATENPQTHVKTKIPSDSTQNTQFTKIGFEKIIASMRQVVHGKRGTARGISKGIRYQMAGKTGTVQVKSIGQQKTYNEATTEKRFRDHSLFIGFAPVDTPKIAIAVIAEHAGLGSKTAAGIARDVIDYYLLERLKIPVDPKS